MPQGWEACAPGALVYRRAYDVADFGEATSLAFDLGEGRWAVLSPPANDPEAIQALKTAGDVAALIAPNSAHHGGLAAWADAFPGATIVAAESVRNTIAAKAGRPVEALSAISWPADLNVEAAPGVRSGSVFVRSGEVSPVVYLDELLVTMPARPRNLMSRMLYRLTRSGPGLSLNRLFLLWFARDKAALLRRAAGLCADAGVICVAHGPSIATPAELDRAKSIIAEADAEATSA